MILLLQGQQIPGPCAQSFMPYGLGKTICDFSSVSWPTPGYCRLDNAFQGQWQQKHDTALLTSFASAKEALAQELLANMTLALKDVKGIWDDLVQLSKVGMPASTFDAFATTYPLQVCDAVTTTSNKATAAAGAASMISTTGRPPLPKGAVLVPAAAAAAAVASPAPVAAPGPAGATMPSESRPASTDAIASPAPVAASPVPSAAQGQPVVADMMPPAPMTGMSPPAPMAADVPLPSPMAAGMASSAPTTASMAPPAPTKAAGNRKMML